MEHDTENLMVCPQCDALYRKKTPAPGELAMCQRCHKVIATPRKRAGMQIISLAFASLTLIVGAVFFPFLRIDAAGLSNSTSVLDVALSFGGGMLAVLVVLTAAFIVFVPALRMILLLYVLVPLVFDRRPSRGATGAFRLAEALKPWAMAEIFALGVAVSLIKVGDLAFVAFGPAFWMFAILIVLLLLQQRYMCSWSVWQALNPKT
ncbi:paraquat-inducible protein A [Tateyamaria sp. SN6-1]|uniref:paraquat-inducible protein A n=1 Tax=Tateyamaria sp. SN6-1 TaxID=3092148 RepID=UPI0039F52DE7